MKWSKKGVKTLIERNFEIKTHANLIWFCSTYLSGCYGPDWKFGGVKKSVKWSEKGVKTLMERKFQMKAHANLI